LQPHEALRPLNWSLCAPHQLLDGCRRSPPAAPAARRGAPTPDPSRPQLISPLASPHRPEAPRLLPCCPQPPEHRPRRSPPPPAALSSSRRRYRPPRTDPDRPQVRTDVVILPHPFTLAAGDRRRRNGPVKPLPPSLTTARDLGLEESKARGAVCKACDSDE
jgi:hypothetical protein